MIAIVNGDVYISKKLLKHFEIIPVYEQVSNERVVNSERPVEGKPGILATLGATLGRGVLPYAFAGILGLTTIGASSVYAKSKLEQSVETLDERVTKLENRVAELEALLKKTASAKEQEKIRKEIEKLRSEIEEANKPWYKKVYEKIFGKEPAKESKPPETQKKITGKEAGKEKGKPTEQGKGTTPSGKKEVEKEKGKPTEQGKGTTPSGKKEVAGEK
ncbi:MAG: hypothetical protein QXH27_04990, partial [Candidatus Micrarchaeia archaeon]